MIEAAARRGAATVALLALSMLASGCATRTETVPASYRVKRGDTLYSIATRFGLDYRELAAHNRIGRDYRIVPGQLLILQRSASLPSAVAIREPVPKNTDTVDPNPVWVWPALSSTVASTERPNGGRGLTIAGRRGQDIRAAADGKVVYTGAGLLGYGQLIIIKHNEAYLSAYGHTDAITVKEGDGVKAGQVIATMGNGPSGDAMLYFEIRVHGRPVDALPLLPRQ